MTHYFLFLVFCSLEYNEVNDEGAKAMVEALKVNATLTELV